MLFVLVSGALAVARWHRRVPRHQKKLLMRERADRDWNGSPVVSPLALLHPHTDFAHRYWAASLKAGDTVVDATTGNGQDAAYLAEVLSDAGGGTLLCIDVQCLALERSRERLRATLEKRGWVISSAVAEAWDARRTDGAKLSVQWLHGDHALLLETMSTGSASLIVFNLGYLPGGDRGVTTLAATTVRALQAAERVCTAGGCVSVTIYPGHTEGIEGDDLLSKAHPIFSDRSRHSQIGVAPSTGCIHPFPTGCVWSACVLAAEEAAVLEYAGKLPQGSWSVYHTQWLNQRNKRNGRRAPSLLLLQLLHGTHRMNGDSSNPSPL